MTEVSPAPGTAGVSLRSTVVMALLPWLSVALVTGSVAVAAHFVTLLAVLFGLGQVALQIGRTAEGELATLLAIPTGLIVGGGILAVLRQLGVPLAPAGCLLVLVAACGWHRGLATLRTLQHVRVRRGPVLALLSLLICGLYFVPGALHDGVATPDGGMRWMYVDTQYHMAVEAAIKTPGGPPRMPGLAVAPISYHYGPFTLAAAMSAMTGVEIADAHARVLRGVGQLALLLAALGLGRVLGRRLGNPSDGGLGAVVGLFFYGSLSALFAPEINSGGTAPALLLRLPFADVIHTGGWFSHLILGHSDLWGGIGIVVGLAFLCAQQPAEDRSWRWSSLLMVLPALVICTNVIAGVGLTGVTVAILGISGWRRLRVWGQAAATLVLAFAAMHTMGYLGSPSTSQLGLDLTVADKALDLWRWIFLGLGVRIVALMWARRWREDPATWALFLFLAGYLAVSFLVRDRFDGHQTYGLKFLQGILSVYAFAWLGGTYPTWRGGRWRTSVAPNLLRVAALLGLVLLVVDLIAGAGLVLGIAFGSASLWSLKVAGAGAVAVLTLAGGLYWLRNHRDGLWRAASRVAAGVCAVGFLAWINPWVNFGLDRLNVGVTLSSDEVAALHHVREISAPAALLATNHHRLESYLRRQERAYGYRVVSERPVLLEGWGYGEMYARDFARVHRDNDLLFATANADSARAIVDRYGVAYIITAPGTELPLAERPVPWLELQERDGAVAVYHVSRDETPTPAHLQTARHDPR